MGLIDFLVSSHSEFSALAHGLSSPHTITLCPPRRAKSGADADDRVACDRTGVPNSVLTHPARWGRAAAPLDRVAGVDEAEVGPQLRRLWEARVRDTSGVSRCGPAGTRASSPPSTQGPRWRPTGRAPRTSRAPAAPPARSGRRLPLGRSAPRRARR
ncbi:unnamed protein product, partial [Prorocentrum cordatum]